ncbi:MAG: cell division protein ZapD, partial [Salinisphaeraceae bacterium]|nr:cell division protein ZapD [Salinisphaeraceae bacterium]
QHDKLRRFADHPDINQERLHGTLVELDDLHYQIQQLQTQHAGSLVRDNEFLNSILNRSTIAGGSCGFDLPGYHLWLNRPPEVQERNLAEWSRNLDLFQRSVELILRLLRTSAEPSIEEAEGGIYQQNMQQPYQLIRVMLPEDTTVFPEISGGKHRVTIRFMHQDDDTQETQQITETLRFQLCCCLI